VNDQEQILLIWRHRFITETWGWELPAGVIDDGETAKEAASREMLEETGWRAGRLHHLVTLEPSNGLADALHHVYWAEGAEYINHPKDDFESTRREWVSLKAMPDLVRDGEIKDGSAAAALLLLHHMRCCSDR
jgi:8-oxo-dGTP pyrophosphatase MutT (NUDIX family)